VRARWDFFGDSGTSPAPWKGTASAVPQRWTDEGLQPLGLSLFSLPRLKAVYSSAASNLRG
jgi:hypothetical protein